MGVGWVAPERQQTGEKAGHLEVIHTCAESLKPGSVGVFTPWKSAMLQIRICLPPPPPPPSKSWLSTSCQHTAGKAPPWRQAVLSGAVRGSHRRSPSPRRGPVPGIRSTLFSRHSLHTVFQVGQGSSDACWVCSRERAPPTCSHFIVSEGPPPGPADCRGSGGPCRHQGPRVGLMCAGCRDGSIREGEGEREGPPSGSASRHPSAEPFPTPPAPTHRDPSLR